MSVNDKSNGPAALKWAKPLVLTPGEEHVLSAEAPDGAKLAAGVAPDGGFVAVTCTTRTPTLPEIASALNAIELPPGLPRTWALMVSAAKHLAASS